MNILDQIKKRFSSQGHHSSPLWIPENRVHSSKPGSESPEIVLESGKHYFRLWLSEMFLKNDRSWFTGLHPAVHSEINLNYGNRSQSVSNIVGPASMKGFTPDSMNSAIQQNCPLTPIMPFCGGSIEFLVGLLAVEGKNDIKTFINVLDSFSKILVSSQFSAALKYAEKVSQGINDFVGVADGKLLLTYNTTLTNTTEGNHHSQLKSGYIALIDSQGDQLNIENLWISDGCLKRGPNRDQLQPFSGWNFALLRIEALTTRDDWESLETIQSPFQNAIDSINQMNFELATQYLRSAISAAIHCDDLTRDDRRKVIMSLRHHYSKFKSDFENLRAQPSAAEQVSLSRIIESYEPENTDSNITEMTEEEALSGLE